MPSQAPTSFKNPSDASNLHPMSLIGTTTSYEAPTNSPPDMPNAETTLHTLRHMSSLHRQTSFDSEFLPRNPYLYDTIPQHDRVFELANPSIDALARKLKQDLDELRHVRSTSHPNSIRRAKSSLSLQWSPSGAQFPREPEYHSVRVQPKFSFSDPAHEGFAFELFSERRHWILISLSFSFPLFFSAPASSLCVCRSPPHGAWRVFDRLMMTPVGIIWQRKTRMITPRL